MVEANIGESPRGSRPKVFARPRSSEGARATPRHLDRAFPTVAFALRRSSSPRAAPVRPSRRARCLLCHAPSDRSPKFLIQTNSEFLPALPCLSRIAARYRAQLDAKLSHLADLQARWNAQGVFDVVKALRRDFGDTGDDVHGRKSDEDDAERRKPREPWIQHEKESVRKALLLFGLGRWAKLRMALKPASRPRHDSHDVQLATWDLVRAMHRRLEPDSPEAKYLADRLRRESPGGERLPADPIVGSWNLGSRGKLNAANCRVWTRRIRMLEMINRSVERLLAEETQDAAIELAGACPLPASDVKRSLPAWWDGACDFSLLYGVYRHGFGNFNAVRSDPWTAAVATEAARAKGGAGAVAELRDSIEAIDECQKLYEKAREEHGARISEQAARANRKGPDGSKGETKEEEAEDSAEVDGDDGDDEGEGDDDDAGNNVPAVGGDKSELVAAKERVERIHEGENAWPRTEDLTDRVRRVAKELGAPNALKPSDPPWVEAMLGHPRRVPKPPMSSAERAARDQKRGEARARAAETESAREEFANAMMRGDWDALGKNGAAASVTSLLCADHEKFDADEGINPEADELVRSTAAALKEKGISNRERKHMVKALMARGLPRLDDNSPDWIELSTMSGVARGAEDVQAIFYSIAVEMKVLEARTDATGGVKASKKHSATCKCIVCRIRNEKKNAEDPSKVTWKDAVKTMKEGGNAAEAQTAASSPTANGQHRDGDDEEDHDGDGDDEEDHDGDDGNDGDEDDDAKDGGEGEKTEVGEDRAAKPGKSRRASVCPFGLLTHVTANRLRERLDIMQTLRMCLEKSGGKMTRLPMPSIKTGELPVWWTSGVHDVAILRAALKHGCDKWDDLAGDAEFAGVFGKSRPVPKAPLCFRIVRIASRYLRRGYLGLGKHTKRKKA